MSACHIAKYVLVENVWSLFQTPAFINQLDSYLATKGKQATIDDDNDDLFDKDDEDDDGY
ncbi:hypothetical protein Hanom_Chr15g01411291 [Helianthus anomalus]